MWLINFSEVKNIVAPTHSSKKLKERLESGKHLIITTIQKFPFIVDGIADMSHKRFVVIIDKAYNSQSGTTADNMNRVMVKKAEEEEEEDTEEIILKPAKCAAMLRI